MEREKGWGEGNGYYIRITEYGCPCCTLHNSRDHSFLYESVLYKFKQRITNTEEHCWGLLQTVKNLPAMQETWVRFLGWEESLGRGWGMATHSSILAWGISQTEESDRLKSKGLQRVGHNWVTSTNDTLSSFYFLFRVFLYFSKMPKMDGHDFYSKKLLRLIRCGQFGRHWK